jgi:predicted Zn-dependent protease
VRRLPLLALALALALGAAPARAHGPFHERIAAASERVARAPRDAGALIARGELYRQHGDLDAALADFARAAALDPRNEAVELLRGRTLVDARRPQLALPHLDRFVARRPRDAAGWLERARAHEAAQARQAAAADYERALALLPRPTPDDYLRRFRAQLAAGRPEAALGGLDEGIARLGPLEALEQPAIELELEARRFDQALARLDRLAALSPRKESFHQRRGEILLRAGRAAEARRSFRAALDAVAALPPHLRDTHAMRALAASARRGLRAPTASAPAGRAGAGGSSRPGDR